MNAHIDAFDVQVATAIRGAIILAKMSVVPVRRGYWGNKIGSVHTVPAKVSSLPSWAVPLGRWWERRRLGDGAYELREHVRSAGGRKF